MHDVLTIIVDSEHSFDLTFSIDNTKNYQRWNKQKNK